jgi:hypothetical protein
VKVLIAVPSDPVRLHHLTPLGWALRAAGHDVKIAGRPDFAAEINATGQVSVEVGTPGRDRLDDEEVAADLADFARLWRPELVIWDAWAVAAAAVAADLGTVAVRIRGWHDRGAVPPAEPSRLLTIDTVPPSLRDPGTGVPGPAHLTMRPVPYDGPAVIPGWMRRDPLQPRVLAVMRDSSRSAEILAAVADLEAEALCCLPLPDAGVRVPGTVRLLDSVPVASLVPTCSAVVHDGSAANSALFHGVPHLDVSRTEADEGTLESRIRRLLTDPAARLDARRLRDEVLTMPEPRELVAGLTALTGH